jgi:hypothetical protein
MGDSKGSRRRVDFVVKGTDGKGTAVEATSHTADKELQYLKEKEIRESGGAYVRDPVSKELIEVRGVSRVIRMK